MLQLFNYNSNPVSFRKANDTVYVNATEMAKPFGKLPNDYLRLVGTSEFIKAIASKNRIAENQIVITERGGLNPGTWLTEDLAIDFAQWLSVDFRLWVADRIKQLLTTGVATITDDDDVIAEAMKVLQRRLEAKSYQLETANKTIIDQSPKVQYYNEVLQSKSDITTTVIGGELGMSAKALNLLLKSHKIQYKIDGVWKLYSKYEGKGYTTSRTHPRNDDLGNLKTDILMTWTEKGRQFIHEFVKSLKISA